MLTPTLLLGMAAVATAGVIAGLTGFGFGLITVPLLLLFLPARTAVTAVLLLSNLIHVMILVETWRDLDIRRIWPMMLAGVVAAPFGAYLLLVMNVNTLKVFIGVIITVTAIALLTGFRRPIRDERLAFVPVGVASGLLSGSAAMGGPPVVLFFSNQGIDKSICRANFTLFFTVVSLASGISQFFGGLVNGPVITFTLWCLPALAIGTGGGMLLARKVTDEMFRKLTLLLVLATGLMAAGAGAGLW